MTDLELTTVQWADATGRGFAPHRTDDVDRTPREYWVAAQQLLTTDVVQPPETIRSTLPHPVWSLRYVRVDQFGDRWCFAVQGRGGPFGVAGTCRFMFAPHRHHPADVWRAAARLAVTSVPAGQRDTARRAGPGPAGSTAMDGVEVEERLGKVLAALVLGPAQVLVPGSPAEVADLIGRILAVLPSRVVMSRIWATCLLQRPEPRNRPVVAGGWPAEFRQDRSPLANQLDQLLGSPLPAPEELNRRLGQRRAGNFDLLVAHALTGPGPEIADLVRRSEATEVVGLLDQIAMELQPLRPGDVPAALDTEPGRRRLRAQPGLVTAWAQQDPPGALRRLDRLDRVRDRVLRHELLVGLVAVGLHGPDNVLGLPESAPSGRHDRAADLLGEYQPDPGGLAELVRRLRAGGPVLTDLAAAHDWLRRLGLSPAGAPDLFPARLAVILTEIARGGRLTRAALDELHRAPDQPAMVRQIAEQARLADGMAAAELVEQFPALFDPRDHQELYALRQLSKVLTDRSAPARRPDAERWLMTMLSGLPADAAPESVRAAMYGGLLALPQPPLHRRKRLVTGELSQMCAGIGLDREAPVAVRQVFEATGLRSDARAPAPTEAPELSETRRDRWLLAGTVVAVLVGVGVVSLLISGWTHRLFNARDAGNPVTEQPAPSTPARQPGPDAPLPSREEQTPPADPGIGAVPGCSSPPLRADLLVFCVPYQSSAFREKAVAQIRESLAALDTGPPTPAVTQVTLTGFATGQAGATRAKELKEALQEEDLPKLRGVTIVTGGQDVRSVRGQIQVVVQLSG